MAKTKAQLERELADMTARAEAAEAAQGPQLRAEPADRLGAVADAAGEAAEQVTTRLRRLWTAAPKALVGVIALAFLGGMIFGGVRGGGHITLVQFASESAQFGLQALILTLFALLVVWVSQAIRNIEWFDRRGAAREMVKVQKRAGTETEQPGDAVALAVQYGSTTLFIAIVVLAYFLIHRVTGE